MSTMSPSKKKPSGKGKAGEDAKPNRGPRESFHMEHSLHAAFLRFTEETVPNPDKSETLRVALREFLQRRGFWPPKPPGESEAKPE
jgi:hypothetical protein